jgi:hypothetical protein
MNRFSPLNLILTGILILLLIISSLSLIAQHNKFDSLAVSIIDRMSQVIGDMKSCRFSLMTATDIYHPDVGMIKRFADYEVFMSGRDKLLINARGYKGQRQYKYNGNELALYSFDENNYGLLDAPGTTIRTIDSLSVTYGIDFPAGDFFYPALTDDIIQNSDLITYLGIDEIDGVDCFHVLASNKEIDIQFWISNDELNLPVKFVINYKTQEGSPQYYASFSNWVVNPDLPAALFDFLPPPGAAKVKIIARNGH